MQRRFLLESSQTTIMQINALSSKSRFSAAGSRRVVKVHAAAPEIDMEVSGLKHLSPEARERALAKKANTFEKVKRAKCGSNMWTEVHELSALLKEGKSTFEELDLDDVEVRLKWAGLFHRKKRAPETFMMRLKVRISSAVYCIQLLLISG